MRSKIRGGTDLLVALVALAAPGSHVVDPMSRRGHVPTGPGHRATDCDQNAIGKWACDELALGTQ